MNRNQMIKQIKNNISLYEKFVYPTYPEFKIYTKQFLDILIQVFNNTQEPYSVIFTDVNKLSVINETYGRAKGDNTLYSLLSICHSNPLFKNSTTIRIGGDEFLTFVKGKTKSEVEKMLESTISTVNAKRKELLGSSLSFGVEDSFVSKNVQELICLAEHNSDIAKTEDRKNDVFLEKAQVSEDFVSLPIPKNISDEQKQIWEVLNAKINIAIDNHLRDLRPSSNIFQYKIPNVKTDSIQFITAFKNLLEQKTSNINDSINNENTTSNATKISPEIASFMYSLFEGTLNLESLDDQELENIFNVLSGLGKNLIKSSNNDLFNESYYKKFLADKLLKSNQNYQAVCFSMTGIRPSNTAYNHSTTDDRMDKTDALITDALKKEFTFNSEAFTFNRNDSFLINEGGGNYLAITPNNKALRKNVINNIVETVNSNYTDGPDSTFKIAAYSKRNINRFTIPFIVNSMNNAPNNFVGTFPNYTMENTPNPSNKNSPIEWFRTLFQILHNSKPLALKGAYYEELEHKPFVLLSRKLKELCNDKKDKLKMDNLESNINEQSIETVLNDLINYYMENIENPNDIEAKRFLLNNTVLALANNEAYINKLTRERYEEKVNERKIFKDPSSRKISDNERE